jgi:hypothetical protein
LAKFLSSLGRCIDLGGLVLGPGLEHLLAFEEGVKLSLRVFQLALRAGKLLHRLIPVAAGPIVKDLSREPCFLLGAVGLLLRGHLSQSGLEGRPGRPVQEASDLQSADGALEGPPLLL